MFSPELENLIDACLQDGILEEHEKKALVKRALLEGVDITELDIYINSKLQKRVMEETVAPPKAKGSTEKKQSNRCPYCGLPIPPLSKTCPGCGAAVTAQTTGDRELFTLIDAMERSMVSIQTCVNSDEFIIQKAEAESLIRKAKLFYGDNRKMQMTVFELENKIADISKRYKPNTKSSIIYYTIMAILAILMLLASAFDFEIIACIIIILMVAIYLFRRNSLKTKSI